MQLAMSISQRDLGFIAGFIEGEATFTIGELNGGQSYSCGMALRLRDDDQDVLERLVALTGLGSLHRVPAYRTSRPQIGWVVQTQDHCQELLALLSRCGFHGRRHAELALWSAAVAAWTTGRGRERRTTMRRLRRELAAARRYGGGRRDAVPLPIDPWLRRGYISGVAAAEGCFLFAGPNPRFAVHLRGDDRPLLELLAATMGVGHVYDHRPAAPLNPSSSWVIFRPAQLARLVEELREADLPSRKRTEMETWAMAVSELRMAGPRDEVVDLAAQQLRRLRTYRPSTRDLLRLPRRDLRAESLEALREWSAVVDGPLSCQAYARWRTAGQPTRNTIASQFGGWQNALAAAGLGERAARKEPRPIGGEARRVRRRDEQRAQVIAAVRQFETEYGRLPRAMEFFRWRLRAAPDSPSQATVYKLFPGGWAAVLAGYRL